MRLSAVHKPFVTPHIFTTSDLAILKTAMCFKGNFCVKSSNSVPVVYMYAKFLCFVSEVGFLMKSVNFLPSSKIVLTNFATCTCTCTVFIQMNYFAPLSHRIRGVSNLFYFVLIISLVFVYTNPLPPCYVLNLFFFFFLTVLMATLKMTWRGCYWYRS